MRDTVLRALCGVLDNGMPLASSNRVDPVHFRRHIKMHWNYSFCRGVMAASSLVGDISDVQHRYQQNWRCTHIADAQAVAMKLMATVMTIPGPRRGAWKMGALTRCSADAVIDATISCEFSQILTSVVPAQTTRIHKFLPMPQNFDEWCGIELGDRRGTIVLFSVLFCVLPLNSISNTTIAPR